MSDRTIRIAHLTELQTARVFCLNAQCESKGAPCIEAPIAKLPAIFLNGKCPICGAQFYAPVERYLDKLAEALGELARLEKAKSVRIEFVLPPEG